MAIQFFYSNVEALQSAKNDLVAKEREQTKLYVLKNVIELDFCRGVPLADLTQETLHYAKMSCLRFRRRKEFSDLDYADLLDALFYLLATGYQFSRADKWLVAFSDSFARTGPFGTDPWEVRSKVYIVLILHGALGTGIGPAELVETNRIGLGDFYDELSGLVGGDAEALYAVLACNLPSCNRMKSYHQRNGTGPTWVGYQNFSDTWAELGLIKLWAFMGTNVDKTRVDRLFQEEFGRGITSFDF